ncbi:hypothetical protein OF83DRAFT_1089194 [Amylostereum chailletii]|nr:hypothetical protein OF83DRAFT_1089194 [Amylostereum chailletii]
MPHNAPHPATPTHAGPDASGTAVEQPLPKTTRTRVKKALALSKVLKFFIAKYTLAGALDLKVTTAVNENITEELLVSTAEYEKDTDKDTVTQDQKDCKTLRNHIKLWYTAEARCQEVLVPKADNDEPASAREVAKSIAASRATERALISLIQEVLYRPCKEQPMQVYQAIFWTSKIKPRFDEHWQDVQEHRLDGDWTPLLNMISYKFGLIISLLAGPMAKVSWNVSSMSVQSVAGVELQQKNLAYGPTTMTGGYGLAKASIMATVLDAGHDTISTTLLTVTQPVNNPEPADVTVIMSSTTAADATLSAVASVAGTTLDDTAAKGTTMTLPLFFLDGPSAACEESQTPLSGIGTDGPSAEGYGVPDATSLSLQGASLSLQIFDPSLPIKCPLKRQHPSRQTDISLHSPLASSPVNANSPPDEPMSPPHSPVFPAVNTGSDELIQMAPTSQALSHPPYYAAGMYSKGLRPVLFALDHTLLEEFKAKCTMIYHGLRALAVEPKLKVD